MKSYSRQIRLLERKRKYLLCVLQEYYKDAANFYDNSFNSISKKYPDIKKENFRKAFIGNIKEYELKVRQINAKIRILQSKITSSICYPATASAAC